MKNTLRKTALAGLTALAIACGSNSKKVEEMVDVDVNMSQTEFVKTVMSATDSARITDPTEMFNIEGNYPYAVSQVNQEINGVPFRLTKYFWRDVEGFGNFICARPINSNGFYAKIQRSHFIQYDPHSESEDLSAQHAHVTKRWNSDSTSRVYAQESCEKAEDTYQNLVQEEAQR